MSLYYLVSSDCCIRTHYERHPADKPSWEAALSETTLAEKHYVQRQGYGQS